MDYFSWDKQKMDLFDDARGYMKTLERHLSKPSRFDNTLLFNMSVLSIEKLLASLLAHYGREATHHTPGAMFREACAYDNGLDDGMKKTAYFIQSFESICTFDSKGYTTPTGDELKSIITGLIDIRKHVAEVIGTT